MHFLIATVLLAATAAAMPASSVPHSKSRRSLHSSEVLKACDKAHNCETYETERGTMIRFVPGMEPNSTNAHHHKRADGDVTHVSIGDGKLNYGTTGASGTYGTIHHLYDTCHEGSCDRTGFSVDSTVVFPANAGQVSLVLQPDGQYNGWDERNAFVDAMVAVAGQGEKCNSQTWMHGGYGTGVESGSENQCTQTNFIGINRFGSDGSLKGYMSVQVSQAELGHGLCGEISGILGAISTVVGAVPGAEVGGAAASGFFGLVSAICQ